MYNRIQATDLSSLFLPMSRRQGGKGVYFVRLCQTDQQVLDSLWKYHELARGRGVIIEGQIANPDDRQLNFLNEMLGSAFQPDAAFIVSALGKWMPRMKEAHRREFADALCVQFDELRKKGKTDSILKNIYTKMMCWLYYRFERLMPFLGDDDPPRILYECPGITAHELILLRLLSSMGADILLLETMGDQPYLKQDPSSVWSQLMNVGSAPFPKEFTLKQFRKDMAAKAAPPPQKSQPTPQRTPAAPRQPVSQPASRPAPVQRDPETHFPQPSRSACTNAWMKEAAFTEILTPVVNRGDDFQLYYNALIRVRGAFDKLTYPNELYQFYQQFRNTGRNIVIIDEGLSLPSPDEAQKVRRHPYRSPEELIIDIAGNLPACANVELQRLMQRAFVRTMKKAARQEPNLNRLTTSAVYVICWIQQYQAALFQGYKGNEIPCFVLMGGCKNQHDALFIDYLSQLPVDVLILACDLNRRCTFQSDALLELTGEQSLPVFKFPKDPGSLQMRTVASNAQEDLSSLLYSDTGLYRNRQFSTADAITLHTTYDEIFILWNQELKYRSNFSTVQQVVNMPVIFAKVSGVERGNVDAYWQKIRLLLGDGTRLYKTFPFHTASTGNPYQALAVKVIRNGKLKRDELKAHRQYPFGLLREELQEHIFDKIQLMLDQRLIKGTFSNGTEYTILSTILNLEKDIVRSLQSFDFTKKNPKVVAVCTTEQVCPLEDAILLTFMNLIGFDIVLFVPTGYQTIERYLNDNFPIEHQIGDYIYDLHVPDFNALPPVKSRTWLDNILKRGN